MVMMMARVPGAVWLPIPETYSQSSIRPTQFILHSLAAPWTLKRVQQFWNEGGVNTESHLYVDYSGGLAQFVDTSRRADANVSANGRAISMESAANTSNSDRWTAAQINTIVRVMKWAHDYHGIPARICRSSTDPGFGIHRMFSSWSGGGTICPGSQRAKQFTTEIWPKFMAAVNGTAPTPPPSTKPTIRVSDVQFGKENNAVKLVQTQLIKQGFSIPAGATGYFGSQTQAAYDRFRRDRLGLKGSDATGSVGASSLSKLMTGYKVV